MLRSLLLCVCLGLFLSPALSCGSSPTDVPPPGQPNKTISWDEAREMIIAGWIKRVNLNPKREVYLLDLNGNQYMTREPGSESVVRLVNEVDPKRTRILIITE